MTFTAEQIAALVGGTIEGDASVQITTFAKIEEGTPGAISFLSNSKYEHYLYETKSSAVLVNRDFVAQHPVEATLIRVDNAYETVAKLLTMYQSMQQKKTGISEKAIISGSAEIGEDCYVAPLAYIGDNVKIGRGTSIYPNVVIEDNVTIGEDCTIYPNVTIYHDCKLGSRITLHAGVVIGADGFGFAPTANGYEKIPQIGIVTIEDDVEIGANTCVDRSTMGTTIIRHGVKLDNLVQIAHNVDVGANTVMSAQVGVAGTSKIGEWCMLGGQVGVSGHLTIGPRTQVGAQSGLTNTLVVRQGGNVLMGYPAVEHKLFAKQAAALKQLPDLLKEVAELKRQLEELKMKKEE